MAVQFAGSRSLDERRRRRLAGISDEEVTIVPVDSFGKSTASTGVASNRMRQRLPLRRIISPRLWKHALIAGVTLLIGVAIVALGTESQKVSELLGPSVGEFVSADHGRLLPFFNATLLMISAELSLLIWWVRSRSRTDFSGRFGIWRWASVVGFTVAACLFLDLHLVWSRTLIWRLDLDFAHCEILCWLAPVVGCGSVLIRDLMADMRNCRSSSTFLWLAVLSWSTSIATLLAGSQVVDDASRRALIVSGSAAFGHYCLFVSLLLHARRVIFVSADPPELRPSLWQQAAKALGGVLLKPVRILFHGRRREHQENRQPDQAKESRTRSRKRKKPPVSVPTKDDSTSNLTDDDHQDGQTQAFVADDFTKDSKSTRETCESPNPAVKTAAGRTIRFDEPHETGESGRQRIPGSRKSKKRRKQRAKP